MYEKKTWNPEDKFTDMELNRMEQGIEDAQNYVRSDTDNSVQKMTMKAENGHLKIIVEDVS